MTGRALALALAVSVAAPASAQTLDAQGRLSFGPDTEVVDLTGDPAVEVWELNARRADLAEVVRENGRALTGTRLLAVGGRFAPAIVDLTTRERFQGRRVEVRVWFRPDGTDSKVELHWHPALDDRRQASHLRLPLLPTGRGTSDGWRELASGPVDWEVLDVSPVLRIDDGATGRLSNPLFVATLAADPEARVWIDALSVTDLGPAVVPSVDCTSQGDLCGEGVCFAGRCVDGRVVSGAPALTRAQRGAHNERRLFSFETFHGERARFAMLPSFQEELEALLDVAPSEFYPGLHRAIRERRFGHAVPADVGLPAATSGLCLGAGTADLLPGSPQLPLVFWIDPAQPAYESIQQGDALVAIDGVDVHTWLAWDQAHRLTPTTVEEPYLAQAFLADAAGMRGATLTFQRCEGADPCAPDEVESYDVDLAAILGAAIREGAAPSSVQCDLRFDRPVGMAADGHASDVGVAQPEAGITLVAFNSFPPQGSTAWQQAMLAALVPPMEGLIFDTRTGNGGKGVGDLGAFVLEPSVSTTYWLARDVDLSSDAVRARLEACRTSEALACPGNEWIPARTLGDEAPLADVPIVVLLGADASGNDFFPLALQERAAPLEIMGLVPTYGWFGLVAFTAPLGGERVGLGIQSTDTFALPSPQAPLSPSLEPVSGQGVAPDTICLQTQSDAVLGVDTCVRRAVEWLQDTSP